MNRLEVEPAGDSGVTIDEHVLGHRVRVRKSLPMELHESGDRPSDGLRPDRVVQLRVLQKRRQRFSSDPWQDERAIGIDLNRPAIELPVDPAFPLLPLPLRKDAHARIQDPDDRTTHPD